MRLGVFYLSPSAVSLVLWLVRQFNNSRFTTRLANRWEFRIPPPYSADDPSILVGPARVIDFLDSWISFHEGVSIALRRYPRALFGAITAVACWWGYIKMKSAFWTISSLARDVSLFIAPQSASPTLTSERAIFFIWSPRIEFFFTLFAE